MTTYLFEGFTQSEVTHRQAETFWSSIVKAGADEAGQHNEWHRWWPTTYGDGVTPIDQEYRPLFDVKCDRINKAIAISQIEPEASEVELTAWVRELGRDGVGQFAGLRELNIQLVATEATVDVARRLIVTWMNEDTDWTAMMAYIDERVHTCPPQ